MEKVGLLDRALAPLHWLERARGWRRLGLAALYVLILSVVGGLGWRELNLWGLPDIAEPFDAARFRTITVADGDNAMILYREAARRFIPGTASYRVASPTAWDVTDWAAADSEVRRWATDNRPGFEFWARGADRRDSLLVQPRDLQFDTVLGPYDYLPHFARFAQLEASRLMLEGDLEAAWGMYRRVLRSSRHAGRHGGYIQRRVGHKILTKVLPAIRHWMDDPKVTPDLLRRGMGDLEECSEMIQPIRIMLWAEYVVGQSVLNHPGNWSKWGLEGSNREGPWSQDWSIVRPMERFFQNEPRRSLQVHRLIYAGLLAQCDRPATDRPKLFSPGYMIYDVDERTPPAVASISPRELAAWAERSALQYMTIPSNQVIAMLGAER